jgi:lipoprotein-releasing system permease protein
VGVALGVLALTVVTSVINGFEGELEKVITGMNGEVIFYSRGEPIDEPHEIEEKIRTILPEVKSITHSFVTELMISGPHAVSGAVLEGIDSDTLGTVTEIPNRLIAGRLPTAMGEIALGSVIADRVGAAEGTEIRLILPFAGSDDPDAAAVPKVVKAHVVGLVRMGMYEYDSKFVFAPLRMVQKILDQNGKVTSFKLKMLPGTDTWRASNQLADVFGPPFRAKDWAQLNKNLFYAIKLEKVVIAIILTFIIIVAAFNVVSTLMMMIHDKTKEIAILKAMGLRPGQCFGLFCLIGCGVGMIGTLIGLVIGAGTNFLLSKTHWIDLPAEIYYIGFLPVVVNWSEIVAIAILALLISFLATIYPAFQITRKSPLDGLRYE